MNENWVHEDTARGNHKRSKLAAKVESHRKLEKGEKVVLVPHPTIRKTWIEKIVNK